MNVLDFKLLLFLSLLLMLVLLLLLSSFVVVVVVVVVVASLDFSCLIRFHRYSLDIFRHRGRPLGFLVGEVFS